MGDNGDINDNNDLLYEINEKGERELVRSIESLRSVYIQFVNRTSRPVDVWWRDFHGRRRHYVRMDPRSAYKIDTYVTHAWEFTDPATEENYLVNNRRVFRPPRALGGVMHRSNWLISVCLRSLRHTVMMTVAQQVRDASRVPELGLPRELQADLENLINAIQNCPDPPPRT